MGEENKKSLLEPNAKIVDTHYLDISGNPVDPKVARRIVCLSYDSNGKIFRVGMTILPELTRNW